MIADGSSVEVLIIAPISDAAIHKVQAVGVAVRVVDGRHMFEAEYRESWPPATARRYLPAKPGPREALPLAERDCLLATAEVALGTFPFPKDLRARAPRLRWFHQLPAGASNLRHGDLWGSDVIVTTSRGHGAGIPIADRKSTRLNSSHLVISYAVFCLKKKTARHRRTHRQSTMPR